MRISVPKGSEFSCIPHHFLLRMSLTGDYAKLAVEEKKEERVRDLTRYVKYPRAIRVQRQKALLESRLKVPPTVAICRTPVDKNLNAELIAFAKKYCTETTEARKERLAKDAKSAAPEHVTTGLRSVTTAIERKQAKLVLIAADVNPIEVCLIEGLRAR